MKAHARVVAEAGTKRSRCTTLRAAPPLTFRATPEGLHLIGTTAGPVGGDELVLDMSVAAGASLTVRSVAAQIVLPAPRPATSTMRMAVEVGPGAELRWLPEPMIVVEGADHRVTTTIGLSRDADLVWHEQVVLGRESEPAGSLLQGLRVERGGRPLLCTEVALGPLWPTSSGPAGTGGARVMVTALLVGEPARAALGARGAEGAAARKAPVASSVLSSAAYVLADDAVLLTVLGDRLEPTRCRTDESLRVGGLFHKAAASI